MRNVLATRSLLGVITVLGLWLLGTTLAACTSDQLPEPTGPDCQGDAPTYTEDIRPIIDASCAYSGCHLDSSPGRFDTYGGLLPYIDGSNEFRQRVILERADEDMGMPPNYAPDGRPKDLTEEQVLLIECWLEAGFPE